MVEMDLRGNYLMSPGLPRDEQLVSRELYNLLCIFAASPEIDRRRGGDVGLGSVYGWSIRSFEYAELCRILISLAAMLRNQWDAGDGGRAFEPFGGEPTVGDLVRDLAHPHSEELKLRESFNKILHADTVNMERDRGPSIYDGHLEPRIHLYGWRGDENWRATIDIYGWIEAAHLMA